MSRARDTADQINRVNSSAADATAITVDSSENVMIGTTSTDQSIAGHGFKPDGFVYHTRDGGAMLRLNRLTSDGDLMQIQKDGTTVGSIGADNGRVYIESSGGGNLAGIGFSRTAVAVEPRKNNAFSSSEVDVGSPTYKFRDAYLSGGVYLGGTGSANKLEDYEEGTWTPTLGGTAVYNIQRGPYTKIGNIVTIHFGIRPSSIGTGSTFRISGIPFPHTPGYSTGLSIAFYDGVSTSTVGVTGEVYNSVIDLYPKTTATSAISNTTAFFQNNARFYATATYITNS